MARRLKTSAKRSISTTPESAELPTTIVMSTIYKDFTIWVGNTIPTWHPIKKMRYVFFRMIAGSTVTDALAEIHWSATEFWHLIDLERHGPFREEYKRAKLLQGRAFSDAVVTIADGRDRVSQRKMRQMRKLIKTSLRNAHRQKSSLAAKAIVESLLAKMDANDAGIITRNKLQIDAAKWIAKTANPQEFSDSAKLAIGGPTPTDGGSALPIAIQFVGPDGTVVPL